MGAQRPRILYLTRNCPFGKSFGGQIRTQQIARLLRTFGDVELGLLLLPDVDPSALERTRAEFRVRMVMPLRRHPVAGLRDRVRHELDPSYLNTEGWQLSDSDAAGLHKLAREYDLVWIHNLAVANGARFKELEHAVLDVDDLRTGYHLSSVAAANSWRERARALRQVWIWKRREAQLLRRFKVLVVCSEADRASLGGSDRIVVIPNGFELPPNQPPRHLANPPRIGFIGLLSYPPNGDGVRWFARTVWPRIKQAHPSVRLRIAGGGADSELARLGPDLDLLGWVEDASAEIATWSLMIVPIRMGGGTRIKIAEGFGRRCPVVSTRLGAFGYDLTTGREILLADDPQDFSRACLGILSDEALGKALASAAWEKYQRHWTWEAMRPAVGAAVQCCLRLQPS